MTVRSPGDRLALAANAAGQLRQLVVGGLGDPQEVAARLGRGIAAGMALEEFRAEPRLERIDVADHGGVVDAQDLGRARNGAEPGDMVGGADLVPAVDAHALCAPVEVGAMRA